MRKLIKTITILCIIPKLSLFANTILPISANIKNQMVKGNTWKENCPIKIEDLRYLKIPYYGFDGKNHIGELIVHKSVANEVVTIFKELKKAKYPIYQMKLASYYKGNDAQSMRHNNTSAFNCRLMTGSKTKWSKHSYGKAIDINPIQNPYVKGKKVLPQDGIIYIKQNRKHLSLQPEDRAMIINGDKIIRVFKNYGWIWGGSWKSLKDYQHFEKKFKIKSNNRPKKIEPKNLFKNLKISESDGVF